MADGQEPLDITTLVTAHASALYRYAYRLTGTASDAEDLVQQVFLIAVRKLDQLRDHAAAKSWLFTILRRAWSKQQRKPQPESGTSLGVDVNLLAVDIPDDLEIDRDELQRAINELPDEFRLVLVSYYFEDCSYKEIAERLELPLGTVMSRLSRAKGHLRARLLASELSANRPHVFPSIRGNGGVQPSAERHESKA